MALTLPTITIDDPVKESRLLAAFPAAGGLTSAQVYKRWLTAALIAKVMEHELVALRRQASAEASSLVDEIQTLLDGAS